MRLISSFWNRKRVRVDEAERAVWFERGVVRGILGPGEHLLPNRGGSLRIERHALDLLFSEADAHAIFKKLPADAARHLTVVHTAHTEVAVIEREGRIYYVLAPDDKLVLWTEAGPWTTTIIDIAESLRIDEALLRRLRKADRMKFVTVVEVKEGRTALISIDGRIADRLGAGVHGYWNCARKIDIALVNLSRRSLDVTGQEILARDRVTLRVNITASYRVVDPILATTGVDDFPEELYRSLQLAFRKALGALTLDQILERKDAVDSEAFEKVRADMAAIGIEVLDVALKDIILPGEMREILNQVVAAQKEAEANIIRRREETNATRSLLNTAKVMTENPVMLRLKELEALESIAGKVERLTVLNGTEGLLNDLVRLRD